MKAEIKTMLERRRAELTGDVHDRIREVRIDGGSDRNRLDEAESAAVGVQDDIGFALIQMKAETLDKIDSALPREGAVLRERSLSVPRRCRGTRLNNRRPRDGVDGGH